MPDLRAGYNEQFLGDEEKYRVPLPVMSLEMQGDVLRLGDQQDIYVFDYIHYSVVMSQSNKQAFFSAANLDQEKFKQVSGRNWFIDSRIGADNQIGPEAYSNNPWDRGHLTRRTAVTWGDTYEAKRASNDSCSYANASLQHANFNQDEWRAPEEVVSHFDKDMNDRLCVFTGPVFTEADRWYTRRGLLEKIRIPSGFWKVVTYIDKDSGNLECQAYVMYQDAHFLMDKRGRKQSDFKVKNYQVTITEIEYLTGLEFNKTLYDNNPLKFYPNEEIGNEGPEAFVAPSNIHPDELDKGVIFNEKDRAKDIFKGREVNLSAHEFKSLLREMADPFLDVR